MVAIYVVWPIISTIRLSFFNWDGMTDPSFVGLANYVELFHTHTFYTALKNNLIWLLLFLLAPPMDPVASRKRPGLDLTRARGHRQIRDRRIAGFTRAVRDHAAVPGFVRHLNGVERFRKRADLIHLDQNRIGDALRMPRDKRSTLVTNKSSPTSCTRLPMRSVRASHAVPIVLGKTVFDRYHRKLRTHRFVEVDHLRAGERLVLGCG